MEASHRQQDPVFTHLVTKSGKGLNGARSRRIWAFGDHPLEHDMTLSFDLGAGQAAAGAIWDRFPPKFFMQIRDSDFQRVPGPDWPVSGPLYK